MVDNWLYKYTARTKSSTRIINQLLLVTIIQSRHGKICFNPAASSPVFLVQCFRLEGLIFQETNFLQLTCYTTICASWDHIRSDSHYAHLFTYLHVFIANTALRLFVFTCLDQRAYAVTLNAMIYANSMFFHELLCLSLLPSTNIKSINNLDTHTRENSKRKRENNMSCKCIIMIHF